MRFTRYYILILSLFGTFPLAARNVCTEIDNLWHSYDKLKTPSEQVKTLIRLADDYVLLDKPHKRDTVFDLAVQVALFNDSLLFNTYKSYFICDMHYMSAAKANEYGKEMLTIAQNSNNNELLYHAYAALAIANLTSNNTEKAKDYVNKAFYHASQLKEEKIKAECMLLMGQCQEDERKKIDAFRNYSDALYIAEKLNDKETKYDALDKLATFYFFLKKYEKAEYYRKKQYDIILKKTPVDSVELMVLNLNFSLILFGKEEINKAEHITQNIIEYSKRNCTWQLSNQAFILYRTYLVDNSLFDKLRDLYEKQYPAEYKKMAVEDTTQYYRLNSYILEANDKPDSAELFYQLAENRFLSKKKAGFGVANFYKRYGEFLLRHGDINTAIQKFDSAYKFALGVNYFPYLIEVTHYLDSLNYLQKNVDKAYQFALLNKNYSNQQALVNKGEEMLQLEVENEARQQELRVEMELKETERHHNIQYTFMVVAIIGVFILLTILGSFKVHPGMIRALGFFSFIFFFEFIIMLADHRIHDFTHGEPWKFMAFKILLIAMLLPLHHWLEEKVIHYLVHHRLLDTSKAVFNLPLFKKKAKPVEIEEKPSEN